MNLYRTIYTGLTAGAIAAIITVGISLPLKSPNDVIFNSASVGISVLILGGVNGLAWYWSSPENWLNRRYIMSSVALLVIALIVAFGAQTQFDNAIRFTVPLALIAVLGTVVLTPLISSKRNNGIWLNAVLIVFALTISALTASQGDQESGILSLPPPPP